MRNSKIQGLAAAAVCLLLTGGGALRTEAAMNLETEAPVAGVAVAVNNYYAGSLDPETELAAAFSSDEALKAAMAAKSTRFASEESSYASGSGLVPESSHAPGSGQDGAAESFGTGEEQILVRAMSKTSYDNVAISHVSNYVNVRAEANTHSAIVGKIYNNCAATILETVEGEDGTWYHIQSGNVQGYIKAQYFITGAEAESIARNVGTSFARVANTTTLRLREEPNLTSKTLDLLSPEAEYEVIGEEGDFAKISVDNDLVGYVFKDYIDIRVEFDQAVTLEEEEAKKAESDRLKKEAEEALRNLEEAKKAEAAAAQTAQSEEGQSQQASQAAAAQTEAVRDTQTAIIQAPGTGTTKAEETAAQELQTEAAKESTAAVIIAPGVSNQTAASSSSKTTTSGSVTGPGGGTSSSSQVVSATRSAVVAYAKQFLGNPYVYGGTSLTNGADCSGFTQEIFKHFGITTGRSSRDQAANGREIAVSSAQPGDLLFYASGNYINHVALYIGDGQVIHASTERTGITISPSNYRTPCKAVSFLD